MVDVYQEWCGPCKALVSTFKRVKNESGDDLLRFVAVWQLWALFLKTTLKQDTSLSFEVDLCRRLCGK